VPNKERRSFVEKRASALGWPGQSQP